jgi:hypothetical protein
MSDGERLLLFLALIYLSGCLLWVDRRTVLFASGTGVRWRAVVADYLWGNSSGRLFLLNPLPPLGFLFRPRLMPVSISPTSIVAYNAQTVGNSGRPPQSGRTAEIAPGAEFSHDGPSLVVDGRPFCDMGDAGAARGLAELLNRIKGLDTAGREQAILGFWRERLGLRGTKERMRAALEACRQERLACSLAFFLFFAVLPLLAFRFGVGVAVLAGAAAMLFSAAVVCSVYLSCQRRHFPESTEGLWGDLAKMMLCPPTAIRACDLIMGKMSPRLDALPLAALLLRGADRESFLKGYLADLEAPAFPDGIPDAVRETCLWQNRAIVKTGVAVIPGLGRFAHAADCRMAS